MEISVVFGWALGTSFILL